MMVREEIQHTNAGQEKFTHTRDFEGNILVKWVLFPWNMDFHLEHHLYQMIPHFALPKLRSMLCEDKTYRTISTVVKGYIFPRKR